MGWLLAGDYRQAKLSALLANSPIKLIFAQSSTSLRECCAKISWGIEVSMKESKLVLPSNMRASYKKALALLIGQSSTKYRKFPYERSLEVKKIASIRASRGMINASRFY